MAEFVAHEVQVAASAGSQGNEPYHFVEGKTAVHDQISLVAAHAPVHILVHQAENDGLVSHQGLIVALGIGDGLLVGALVGQFVPYSAHAPLLVLELFDPFYPVVGYAHGHTEVKAHPAGGERSCKTRHSAHVLGYRDSLGVDFVYEHICKRQILDRVLIDSPVEIQGVVAESLAQPVIPVQHTGHSVEAEAVKVILLHPVLAVRKQEVFDFILPVVETPRAPGRMMSSGAGIEVQVVPPVEAAQAFGLVAHGVRVDYIHNDGNAPCVGVIDKCLELLRSAEAGAESKEIGHLIAERPVVGMLLQGHYLKDVVAQGSHSRKDLKAELLECADLLLLAAHSYMALVDERMGPASDLAVLPHIRRGVPYLGAEQLGLGILDSPCHIGGQPLSPSARPLYPQFVQISVMQEHRGQPKLPVALSYRGESISLYPFPIVEISNQKDAGGIGSPLPYHPLLTFPMERIVKMVIDPGTHRALPGELLALREDTLATRQNRSLVGFKPRISFENRLHFFRGAFFFAGHRFSSVLVFSVLKYVRHSLTSSAERLMHLSISSSPVEGSSTLWSISSSSRTALL